MNRLWHLYILDHQQMERKVTTLLRDTSKGILTRCECGKVWTR